MSKHPVVHIDIPASDPVAASTFYAEAFGWNIQIPPGYEGYPMFQEEKGPSGGFAKLGMMQGIVDKPGDVLIYLDTEDIDASLAKVTAHGGAVIQAKTEIPGVGWWAAFTDPTGNRMGLFTNAPRQ
jgi:predicted enzyme related to lactoylglutathione lyase